MGYNINSTKNKCKKENCIEDKKNDSNNTYLSLSDHFSDNKKHHHHKYDLIISINMMTRQNNANCEAKFI